ncbi:hypothetical protein, partial [Oceanihabitans sediminis]|uniref:hypothetical protein n=1 Tax=Oceanihabitans sediminis TaxID=1812012 RepID=UPI00299E5320
MKNEKFVVCNCWCKVKNEKLNGMLVGGFIFCFVREGFFGGNDNFTNKENSILLSNSPFFAFAELQQIHSPLWLKRGASIRWALFLVLDSCFCRND